MPFVYEAVTVQKAFQTTIHLDAWKTKANVDVPARDAIFAGDATKLEQNKKIVLSEVLSVTQHEGKDVLVSRRWEDARK